VSVLNVVKHYGLPDVYASGPELSGAQSAFKNILTCANLIFLVRTHTRHTEHCETS